jgi:methionyl-tRNA synthetase
MNAPVLTAVAWPYANGPRHIGHVSGFGVPSDIFARYQRMAGNRVLMISGTDENGTPIQVQADAEGVTPRELADKYNRMIVGDLQGLGLSYDLFTRTTTANHHRVVQELFLTLHRNGYVISRSALGAISPSTGRTLPDRYIEGTCPICGYDSARGDQCDNCGNQLDPADLISPRSRINGETPKFVQTEHLFLDLPAFTKALGGWLSTRTEWRPNVLKFSLNLLDDLRPRPITRDLDWGVRVPLDGWRNAPMKRFYVWFDAVIGYLSASVEWAVRSGDPDAWQAWWCDPDARSYYFMGKDNITFHSQIWPAMLLGQNGVGDRGGEPGPFGTLNLPTEVVSSEFLTMSGSKFSTSRGTVIYVGDFLREFGGRSRDPRHRLHLGRVRPPDQLRAGQRVGQPGEPLDRNGAPQRRRGAATLDAAGGRFGAADHVAGGLRRRRDAAGTQPVQGGDQRGDASGGRGEQVPLRAGTVEVQ